MFLSALAISPFCLYILSPLAFIASVLLFTRIWTTLRYWKALRDFHASEGGQIVHSPPVPYSIPYIGHGLSFLTDEPGKAYRVFPRSTGVCTLLMAGMKTHIIYSPPAIQALFRARSPSRDVLEQEMFSHVFDMSKEQIEKAEAGKQGEVEANNRYMFNHERVNELTAIFTRFLVETLNSGERDLLAGDTIRLYQWIQQCMFTASCNALFGSTLLDMYPNYSRDFFGFDNDFMSFFFQLPKVIMGDAHERRARMFGKLERWAKEMCRRSGGSPVDPEGPMWEPHYGSRLTRARHLDYVAKNLNTRSAASLDAGITFALMSNAIPATGWMLFHILGPQADPALLPRVLAELERAKRSDSSLDVTRLASSPLLQSIFTDSLRLHTDVLVTRNLTEDILLPLDEDGKCHVAFKKGDNVFAPSWMEHRDPSASWGNSDLPSTEFDPDRFLVKDPKTGEESFNMSRSTGRFFPFGGGKTMCPGRNFAKQESLAALGIVLSRYEFELKGNVDGKGRPTTDFPAPRRAVPGSGVLAPGGDIMVKVRTRSS